MDRQEYLNQISAKNKPTKGLKSGIFASKFFWVGAIGGAVLVLILIIGAIIGNGKPNIKDNLFSLMLHIDNTSDVIKEYQSDIKSSELRSYSASLYSVLSNTSKNFNDYAVEKYDFKKKDIKKRTTEEEKTVKENLENELFEAKINGNLDRIFVHKMIYEISIITTREEKILKETKDSTLKEYINTSMSSLENLYNKFNDFSEAN